MVCVGLCVLLLVCVRYTDPVQQSLQVLQQLQDMQRNLQEALQRAGEAAGEAAGGSERPLIVSVSVYREQNTTTGRQAGGGAIQGGGGATAGAGESTLCRGEDVRLRPELINHFTLCEVENIQCSTVSV